MKTNARSLIVGVCMAVAAVLGMRTSAAAVDASVLLREAGAALAEARTLSFQAESQGTGAFAATEPLVRASVAIDEFRLGKPDQWRAALRGSMAMSDPARSGLFESYIDTGDAMVFRHATRELLSGRSADASGILEDGGGREAVWWLIEWLRVVTPAAAGQGGYRVLSSGQRSVAGELCEVVRIDASAVDDVETDTWWFISINDRLPRRVDRLIHTDRGVGIVSLVLSDLKAGAPIDPQEFRRAMPLQYEPIEFDPSKVVPKYRPRVRSPLAPGTLVPEFELATPTGQQRRLSDVRERVVVLVFWASWSKPCTELLPRIESLVREREGRPLTVYALSTGDRVEAFRTFAELKLSFEMLVEADAFARRVAVGDLPTTVIVGADGRVAGVVNGGGEAGARAIGQAVDAALGKAAP
ncbi:MAG: peroxiredoxin family protein [Phycisphaerales bacterium]